MMKALEQGQLFSRRDIQRVLDALDGVNKGVAGHAPADSAMNYYQRGFEAALDAVSTALGVPKPE